MEGFLQTIQAFIDFILKLIALFKSNEDTEAGKTEQ